MLIFLNRAVTHDVKFLKLDSSHLLLEELLQTNSSQLMVLGWGVTNTDTGSLSNKLMEMDLIVITNEICDASSDGNFSYEGQITDSMLCAMNFGEDSCQGDSGGPLVLKSSQGAVVQVGVVSWGFGCAHKDFPGVYYCVASAYDWLIETTCRRSVSPPADFNCDDMELSRWSRRHRFQRGGWGRTAQRQVRAQRHRCARVTLSTGLIVLVMDAIGTK